MDPTPTPQSELDEPLPEETPPEPPRFRWPRSAFLLPVVTLLVVAYFIPLPYFVVSPGSAEDVEPLIRVRVHQVYPSKGHLLLTDVYLRPPNLYRALEAWWDPAKSVLPERQVLGPGESPEQEYERALSDMDTSKIDAAVVALTRLTGYPKEHRPGVLVESVAPGAPADGRLFAGDLITAVDGRKVTALAMLRRIIRSTDVGHPLAFTVHAGGKTRIERVAPARVSGLSYPVIGVALVENFPFPLDIESGDIGGPSAGLMWALGLIDLLTPGDLTGGQRIAGTGTIGLDGSVGPIGGVEQKVVAAERAGAKVFFVPADNAQGARSVADHIVLVVVRTYDDAIRYLQAHGGSLTG